MNPILRTMPAPTTLDLSLDSPAHTPALAPRTRVRRVTRAAPGVCLTCGRSLPDQRGKPGRTRSFCAPARGQQESACALFEKRMAEFVRITHAIFNDVSRTTGDTVALRASVQAVRGTFMSEVQSLVNSLGPQVKRRKT